MEVSRLRSQVFIALEQMTAHLCQKMLTASRETAAAGRRLQGALRAGKSGLRRLVAVSRDATVAANARITREVFIGSGHLAIHLQQAQDTFIRLARRVAGQPRRLRESLRARESDLRALLASSPDAIVVTDVSRRFVEANPKGIDLFGFSEANMRKFTVDIFVSRDQIPDNGNGSPFRRRNAKYGRCEIRRLDGSLRVAEYRFIANFVPFRHVYKFRNVVAINQYQPATLRTVAGRFVQPNKSAARVNKSAFHL